MRMIYGSNVQIITSLEIGFWYISAGMEASFIKKCGFLKITQIITSHLTFKMSDINNRLYFTNIILNEILNFRSLLPDSLRYPAMYSLA